MAEWILNGLFPMSMFLLVAAALCAVEPSGQIAFVSGNSQSEQCVCVLDVTSRAVTRVGAGKGDGAPCWSPDGEWIAFESPQEEGISIHVVRADGSEGRALTHKYPWNRGPRWSSDGRQLVYASDAKAGLEQIAVIYDLESNTESEWNAGRPGVLRPVWLPNLKLMKALNPDQGFTWEGVDSEKFVTEALESGALVAIGLVGETGKYTTEPWLVTRTQFAPLLQLLTKDSLRYTEWAMEPDSSGEHIAFETNDGGDREIFVIGKRGINNVTNHRAADWNPVWAPDGKWLAFESFRGGHRGVYRVFPDTARVFPVAVPENADCWSPTWSPDGAWLAYVSDQTGGARIFVRNVAAETEQPLSEQATQAYAPAWRPEPKP